MRSALAIAASSLALVSVAALALGETRGYVVVVNESNPKASIATADLARVFMKTVKRWDNGRPVEPIDQSFESPVRAQFSRAVLGKTSGSCRSHWLRETYSGREIPPPVRGSDAAVLEFVRANPGAIGYVSAGTSLPSGVKALTVNPYREEPMTLRIPLACLLASALLWPGSVASAQVSDMFHLNGYSSFEFEKQLGDKGKGDPNGSFDADLFDLVFNFTPVPRLRVSSDLTWEHGAASEDGRGNVAVEYAFAEVTAKDWLKLRAGKMFTAFGIYNEIHTAKPAFLTVKEPLEHEQERQVRQRRPLLPALAGGHRGARQRALLVGQPRLRRPAEQRRAVVDQPVRGRRQQVEGRHGARQGPAHAADHGRRLPLHRQPHGVRRRRRGHGRTHASPELRRPARTGCPAAFGFELEYVRGYVDPSRGAEAEPQRAHRDGLLHASATATRPTSATSGSIPIPA